MENDFIFQTQRFFLLYISSHSNRIGAGETASLIICIGLNNYIGTVGFGTGGNFRLVIKVHLCDNARIGALGKVIFRKCHAVIVDSISGCIYVCALEICIVMNSNSF